MDNCHNCIRYKDFEFLKCNNCGSKCVKGFLNGPLLTYQCPKCGYAIIGASFFTPCEQDITEYMIKIQNTTFSHSEILLLSRLFNLGVLEIYRFINCNKNIFQKFRLRDTIEIIKQLDDSNISYIIEPSLNYSKINDCYKKLLKKSTIIYL